MEWTAKFKNLFKFLLEIYDLINKNNHIKIYITKIKIPSRKALGLISITQKY